MATRAVAMTIQYVAWDTSNNVGKTGDAINHTLRWVKDGTANAPTNSPSEVDATNCPGLYKLQLTSAETDCNIGTLAGKSSSSGVSIIPVTIQFERLPDAAPGASGGIPLIGSAPLTNLDTTVSSRLSSSDARLDYLDTTISTRASAEDAGAIRNQTDKLTFDGDYIQAKVYAYNTSQSPAEQILVTTSNKISVDASNQVKAKVFAYDTGLAPPTKDEIADQVWDEQISQHQGEGTTGKALSNAASGNVDYEALADAVWDELLSGHTTSGSAGKVLNDTGTNVGGIKTKTDNLNFDGNYVQSKVYAYNTDLSPGEQVLVTPANKISVDSSNQVKSKIFAYETGFSPAEQILVTTSNKISVDSSNQVKAKVFAYDTNQSPAEQVLVNVAQKVHGQNTQNLQFDGNNVKAKVFSYDTNQSPAEQILVTPSNKISVDISNQVKSKVFAYDTGQSPSEQVLVNVAQKVHGQNTQNLQFDGNNVKAKIYAYDTNQSPAEQVLVTPSNKISVDTSNQVKAKVFAYDTGLAPPTKDEIADQVWDEQISQHQGEGTTGKALANAASGNVDYDLLADAVWDELLSGHQTEGSAGKALSDAAEGVGGATPEEIWNYSSRTLTDKENFSLVSAYDAAKTAASQTTADAIKAKTDKLQFNQDNYVLSSAENLGLDVIAQFDWYFGTVPQNVWQFTSRSLTDKENFSLVSAYDAAKTAASQTTANAIKTQTDKLNFTGTSVQAVVTDKTGFSLTSDYNAAKTAASQSTVLSIKNKTDNLQFNAESAVFAYTASEGGGPGGSGMYAVTVSVKSNNVPVQGARVMCMLNTERYIQNTGAQGTAVFHLNGGNWTIVVRCAGYYGNQVSASITADSTVNISLTPYAIPESAPGFITAYTRCYDENGLPQSGVIITCRLVKASEVRSGVVGSADTRVLRSGADGLVIIDNLQPGAEYAFAREGGEEETIRIPLTAKTPWELPSFIGG